MFIFNEVLVSGVVTSRYIIIIMHCANKMKTTVKESQRL